MKSNLQPEPGALLGLLRELGRLDVGLLLRDLDSRAAVATLQLVQEQVDTVLGHALVWRRDMLEAIGRLEGLLAKHWPRAEAAEALGELSRRREVLLQVDQALRPALGLYQEIQRRCRRGKAEPRPRARAESNEAAEPDSRDAALLPGEGVSDPGRGGAVERE